MHNPNRPSKFHCLISSGSHCNPSVTKLLQCASGNWNPSDTRVGIKNSGTPILKHLKVVPIPRCPSVPNCSLYHPIATYFMVLDVVPWCHGVCCSSPFAMWPSSWWRSETLASVHPGGMVREVREAMENGDLQKKMVMQWGWKPWNRMESHGVMFSAPLRSVEKSK